MYETVHVWGDSLGKGVVFDEDRGRYCITPARCVPELARRLNKPFVNHSRMGSTAEAGLEDFMQTQVEGEALVVIEFGGNDCDMPWKAVSENPDVEHEAAVPLPRFIRSLERFVEAVRRRGMLPLLVTPPPLDAGRYFNWVSKGLSGENILRYLGDVQHIYRWQEKYAVAVRNVADSMRCAFFDLRYAMLCQRHYTALVCADGIHLNAKGQEAATEAVLAAREALLGKLSASR